MIGQVEVYIRKHNKSDLTIKNKHIKKSTKKENKMKIKMNIKKRRDSVVSNLDTLHSKSP